MSLDLPSYYLRLYAALAAAIIFTFVAVGFAAAKAYIEGDISAAVDILQGAGLIALVGAGWSGLVGVLYLAKCVYMEVNSI